jgi:hypothetical protein
MEGPERCSFERRAGPASGGFRPALENRLLSLEAKVNALQSRKRDDS